MDTATSPRLPRAGAGRRRERRGQLRLWAGLGLALLLAAAPRLGAQEPPRARQRWLADNRESVHIAGNVRAASLERVAAAAGEVRAAVLSLLATPDHSSPLPTRIVLFKDRSDVAKYARDATGIEPLAPLVTARGRLGRTMALAADELETALPELRRILTLDLIDELLPAAPQWLRVGLPPLLGGLEMEGSTATLSAGDDDLAPKGGWPSSGQLLASGTLDTIHSSQLRPFAVAIVRYLLSPGTDRSAQFTRYLLLLRSGGPEALAFDEAFATNLEGLSREIRSHNDHSRGARSRGQGGGPILKVSVTSESGRSAPVTLAYSEVLNLLGDLISRVAPWNTVAAELHYRQALESDPESSAAWRGIAVLRDLDHRPGDALEMYDRSLALAPADVDTLTLAGWSRIEDFRRRVGTRRGWEPEPPQAVAVARAHCAKALEIDPDLAPALHCYGTTFLYERSVPAGAAAALDKAHRRLPRDPEILLDLVLVHGHRGDFDTAWHLYRGRLQRLASPASLSLATKILVEDALALATDLVLAEELAAARQILELTREEAPDPRLDESIDALAELAEGRRRDRLIALHNRAAELVRDRRWQEARELLDTLLASDLPDDLSKSTSSLLVQLPAPE